MVVAAVCVFGLQVSLAVFPLLIVPTKVSASLKKKTHLFSHRVIPASESPLDVAQRKMVTGRHTR